MGYIYLYGGIALILFILGAYLYAKVMTAKVKKLEKEISDKDASIKELQNKLNILQEAFDLKEKAREELAQTLNKIQEAKTEDEKNKIVTDSIANFRKRT